MASRTPNLRRWETMSTTSPSQQGVEGTDSQEVWIISEESVILVISTSLFGKSCILPQRRHILCLLATFQRLVAQFVDYGSHIGVTTVDSLLVGGFGTLHIALLRKQHAQV